MIDRQRRDLYAELIRHFVAGRMTTDRYEKEAFRRVCYGTPEEAARDRLLWEVFDGVWETYDDIFPQRLRSRRAVSREGRHHIARWIMFLYSNREYEGPSLRVLQDAPAGCPSCLLLGLFGSSGERSQAKPQIDIELWPYMRREDVEEDRRQPRLLPGPKR